MHTMIFILIPFPFYPIFHILFLNYVLHPTNHSLFPAVLDHILNNFMHGFLALHFLQVLSLLAALYLLQLCYRLACDQLCLVLFQEHEYVLFFLTLRS